MNHAVKQLLLSSRPISWINTAFPFAATYLVLQRNVTVFLVVGTVFFLLPYNLLLYGINDVFDYESDLRNPRKNGIEGIRLTKDLHKLTINVSTALCLPFVVYLSIQANEVADVVLAFVIFGVVAYSAPRLRFKERPFLDSVTSSLHFVGPMLYALAVAGGAWAVAAPYAIAFFLWGLASHSFGAVQDIAADKAAGIGSVATIIGAKRTVRFALTCYLASIATLLLQQNIASIVSGLALVSYVINVIPYAHISDAAAGQTNKAWRRFIYLNYACGAAITMALIASLI